MPLTDEFQELVHAENKIVDAFNSEDFDPAQFYTEDFMLMPVGKEVVQGRKGMFLISIFFLNNSLRFSKKMLEHYLFGRLYNM